MTGKKRCYPVGRRSPTMHDFLDDIRNPFSCRGLVRRIRLLAFALPIISCLALPAASADTALQIYVIDVAQGDSTLVVGPGRDGKRATLLIDAGDFRRTDGASLVERIHEIAGVEHLDHVVLSCARRCRGVPANIRRAGDSGSAQALHRATPRP